MATIVTRGWSSMFIGKERECPLQVTSREFDHQKLEHACAVKPKLRARG